MHVHDEVIAQHGEVVARVLSELEGVEDAIALLDEAESHVEVPLVDEAERERLRALASGDADRASHWHSLLARREAQALGYAGVLLPDVPGSPATGDVAVSRQHGPCGPALTVLLAGLEALAKQHLAGRLEVWIRHARPDDVVCATHGGYGVERRLGVLGRSLVGGPSHERDLPDLTVRPYRPEVDDAGVVAVLAAAYEGTPDGGWDRARFRERRSLPWFDPQDLLVAEQADGSLGGVHWLKRRSATVGEVYNLAIHPDAQGRGLGAVLLAAGLDHLRQIGCTEVLLWVDLANERAVRLYTSQGFVTRWEDIALARTLRSGGRLD
jgi:mycothiol synthase